jgi:hypothetical protein
MQSAFAPIYCGDYIWEVHGHMGTLKVVSDAPHGQRFRAELFRQEKVHSYWVPVPAALRRRLPAIGPPREDTMRQATMRQATMRQASMVSALVVMLSFTGPAAHAQIAPQQGPSQQIAPQQGPSQDVLAPAPKLNLTLEQRHTIKELVKDMKADAGDVQATIGEPIPPGINPRPMPSDVSQKVPQVKSHRFFLTAQQIVIVDPKDNKVADVIKLGTD